MKGGEMVSEDQKIEKKKLNINNSDKYSKIFDYLKDYLK